MLAKTSIAFLLNPVDSARVDDALAVLARHRKRPSLACSSAAYHSPKAKRATPGHDLSPLLTAKASDKLSSSIPNRRLALSSPSSASESTSDQEKLLATKPRRKRVRVRTSSPCTVAGCSNLAVTKGCCVRHGGGAKCEVAGCDKRAKKNKRCFTHGGCAQCQHDGCTSKAKRYGFCWAHGGGKPCTVAGCDKVGGQGGLCWAHGGGSRCRVADCTRRSYQKDGYLCAHHQHTGVAV